MPPKKAKSEDPPSPKKASPKKTPQKKRSADENNEAPPPPREESPTRKRSKKADGESADSKEEGAKKPSAKKSAPVKEDSSPVRRRSSGPAITEDNILEGTVPFKRLTADSDYDGKSMLRIVSWNVAGLRGLLRKGDDLQRLIRDRNPDVLCLQETKISDWDDCPNHGVVGGYSFVDSISVAKKGYSGTRTYVRDGIDHSTLFGFDLKNPKKHDDEGRILTTEFAALGDKFRVANSYVPNAGMTLDRLDFRVGTFDPMMRKFLAAHQAETQNFIWTGDLNVAERDYDRFFATNFKQMQKSPGFTPEERTSFRETLQKTSMIDAFRHKYPNASKVYSFWSARFNQRAQNNGWRLDYFVVSASLAVKIVDCFMLPNYESSDHCPVELWLKK